MTVCGLCRVLPLSAGEPSRRRHVLPPCCAAALPDPAARPCRCLQDITYTVVNSQNKKEQISLLKNVSGYILPSEMTALMG